MILHIEEFFVVIQSDEFLHGSDIELNQTELNWTRTLYERTHYPTDTGIASDCIVQVGAIQPYWTYVTCHICD